MVRRFILAVIGAAVISGCASLSNLNPVSSQHPSWAMNPATCTELGAVMPFFINVASFAGPGGALASVVGAISGNALCSAESSLVAGPPAQVTTVTTTQSATTKGTL